jgi:hypothetical protein
MYQGGCREASAWESVLLEAGTELSFHTFQCIREAVGRPQHGNLFFWRLELSLRSILFNVSGRLWRGLSMGVCCCGGWNRAFIKLK